MTIIAGFRVPFFSDEQTVSTFTTLRIEIKASRLEELYTFSDFLPWHVLTLPLTTDKLAKKFAESISDIFLLHVVFEFIDR